MSIREEFERRCIIENSVITNHHRSAPMSSRGCRCGAGCESVLECEFWYWLRKTDLGERRALRQFRVGNCRVDCVIECGDDLVVIELDGQQFHQDKQADFERDTKLLQHVDAVIHIPYAAMHWYPDATMEVLGSWYSRLRKRGCDTCCIHASEIEAVIARNIGRDGDYPTREQWIEQAEASYDVWYVKEFVGWAASIKSFLLSWKCAPIVLRNRTGAVPCAGRRVDEPADFECYSLADSMRSVIDELQAEAAARKAFLARQ